MWVGKLECAIIFLSAIIFLTSIQNSQTTNKKREMDPGTRVLCAWRTKAVFLSATESREKAGSQQQLRVRAFHCGNEMSTQVIENQLNVFCIPYCRPDVQIREKMEEEKRVIIPNPLCSICPITVDAEGWLRLAPAPLFTTGQHRCFCICKADPALAAGRGSGSRKSPVPASDQTLLLLTAWT